MSKKLYSLLLLCVLLKAYRKAEIPGPSGKIPDISKEGVDIKVSVSGKLENEQVDPAKGLTISGGGRSIVTAVNGVFI